MSVTLRQIRDKAAEIIENDGWFQGGYYGPGGSVCALSALYVACGELGVAEHDQIELIKSWKPWTGFSVVAFNDALGRTKAEVLQLLRDVDR